MSTYVKLLIGAILLLNTPNCFSQGVGINTSGADPDPSAILDLSDPARGLLIPRLTQVQRDALSNQANALMIYNSTSNCFEWWDQSGLEWIKMSCGCTIPATPTAEVASEITTSSFTAHWQSVNGATAYMIDVAEDEEFNVMVHDNVNAGNFTSILITGVSCGTTYYYRVRAARICGASQSSESISVTTTTCPFACGDSFTDARDGKVYTSVLISGSASPYCAGGGQCWMGQNLNAGVRINGSVAQTNNSTLEKYCYDDNEANCSVYGGLYLWDEAMNYGSQVSGNGPGPLGICPDGWHLPTDNEWKCLEMNLGMSQASADQTSWRGTNEGDKLKTTGNGSLPQWASPSAGTNSSGYAMMPAGVRTTGGSFAGLGTDAAYWTASDTGASAYRRTLFSGNSDVLRDSIGKSRGYSLRCVKD